MPACVDDTSAALTIASPLPPLCTTFVVTRVASGIGLKPSSVPPLLFMQNDSGEAFVALEFGLIRLLPMFWNGPRSGL